MQTKSLPLDIKSVGDDGTFAGYCNVFDVVDSYDEIVRKGAFATSLADWQAKGKMPPVLWQHDHAQPIGIWTKLVEDDKGLYGEAKLLIDDVPKAREAYALIKAGVIDGLSIGYRVSKYAYNDDGTTDLLELKLREVSIVTVPANEPSTISSVKAHNDAKHALAILQKLNQSF
ncbi:prohead peptidase. Unknown type peptidase. MEROPS family U35 [Moraxella cuniculi DSM 21768]|uniref:Prohead serine protease domain-containing protein n=1 Tax=Moraxella cuniculi DSM 21768 TaxID=1122245 RepID=A0A1N7G6X6_9GAMM|nr:HK97 family phage prohead protease [Moraxella cuniculi]OOS04365.1 hypothetical protein B0189_08635 [Moraxella cuniculi]SIS08331.1 prohead peptidase. Unknown type peptidase. MEROPS family U35 [Moraxella cuniculi DSM 21768]